MTKIPDHVYIEENCPQCNGIFKIPKCSYCKHVHRNYYYYIDAKKCEDCNLFHRNFEYNPNAEEDYQKTIEILKNFSGPILSKIVDKINDPNEKEQEGK